MRDAPLSPYHHNPLDRESYEKFCKDIAETYAEDLAIYTPEYYELQAWLKKVPLRWRKADLNENYRKPEHRYTANRIKEEIEARPNKVCSFFLYGRTAGCGKTWFAYSIVRHYLTDGLLEAHQVQVVSMDVLNHYTKMGFEGYNKIEKMLNPKCRLFVIDGLDVDMLDDNPDLGPALYMLINFAYNNVAAVVITSNDPPGSLDVVEPNILNRLNGVVRAECVIRCDNFTGRKRALF